MADVTMPRLSDTMEEGTIASWLKKPGEEVSRGEVIAQIETDKATMDLTAFEAGTLQEILAPEGTTVPIGQPVARIGKNGAPKSSTAAPPAPKASGAEPPAPKSSTAAPPAPKSSSAESSSSSAQAPSPGRNAPTPASPPPGAESTGSVKPETPAAKENVAEAPEPTQPTDQPTVPAPPAEPAQPSPANGKTPPADGKTRASPMARHIAAEHGLDLAQISGSGPQGRVIRADVEAALSQAAPTAAAAESGEPAPQAPTADGQDERVPLSQMRRTIARRMAESTRTVPHFFLTTTVDATDLVALRKQILEQLGDAGPRVSINDLIVKAVAQAIRQVPEVNVSFADDSLIRHQHVNIGVAVATERGLIVPVVRDVDQKTLTQIARETRDLADRAQSGKLQPPDYSGGTFTISNLGMFGVEQFNAVINPPEAAILAVGAITREPAEHQGQIALRDRLKLTLSVDHRALDGAQGARYLQALKKLLEKPMLLLV